MTVTARQSWMLRMSTRLWWVPVVLIGLLIDRGSRVRWLLTPGIAVLAASLSTAGKLMIRRPRPDASMRVAPPGRLGAAGFPSTHATCAFAIAGWQRRSRHRRWLHLVAICIGYLRVHRRAHYSRDVVAGAILGYGIAWQVEGVWSRLVTLRPARPGRRADSPHGASALAPRSVDALVSRNRLLPYRDRIAVLGGHKASFRPSGRRNGAFSLPLGKAKDSALEVR
jgi:membrane-associated phospholipid phosphatase